MGNNLYTDKLEEKIYYGNSTDNIEEIQKVLNDFINEVIKRRRNDEEEEGLQSVFVIGKEEFGAKIFSNVVEELKQNNIIIKNKIYNKKII